MPEPTKEHRKTALALIASVPDAERALLFNWAQQVIAIRQSDLGLWTKARRIAQVTNELGMTKPLAAHLASEVRRIAWTGRSKPMRGVIGGAGIGLVASVGAPMAGVAAFGGAIAVPVILLGAGAGAVLMAVVDEIDRENRS